MGFYSLGYWLFVLFIIIPQAYYFLAGTIIIFVTFIPPYLGIALEKHYRDEKDASIIEYLVAKNSKIVTLTQVFSIVMMGLYTTISYPSSLYTSLAGILGATSIILFMQFRMREPSSTIEDRIFRSIVKAAIYVEITTKYEKIKGKIISIGDYLIIKDRFSAKHPLDWHSITSISLLKDEKQVGL